MDAFIKSYLRKERGIYHFVFCLLCIVVFLQVNAQTVFAVETPGYDGNEEATDEYKFKPLVIFPDVEGKDLVRPLNADKTLAVVFSPEVAPNTIMATLNGSNVTEYFKFTEESIERGIVSVELPFVEGKNKFEIVVSPKEKSVTALIPNLSQIHKLTIRYEPLQMKMHTSLRPVQFQLTEDEQNLPREELIKRMRSKHKNKIQDPPANPNRKEGVGGQILTYSI